MLLILTLTVDDFNEETGQLHIEIMGLAKPNGPYRRNPLRVTRDPGWFLVTEF